jgi:phage-related protein
MDLLELCTSFFFCLIWSRLLYSRWFITCFCGLHHFQAKTK